jgi:hypothetical protein
MAVNILGPAAKNPAQNHEAHLKVAFPGAFPHTMSPYSNPCLSYWAIHWKCERTGINKKAPWASYSICCQKGQVSIPVTYTESGTNYPQFLKNMLISADSGMYTSETINSSAKLIFILSLYKIPAAN